MIGAAELGLPLGAILLLLAWVLVYWNFSPRTTTFPDLDRRWVTRVPVDPYLRFDSNDYSLDPTFAGRRVEIRVSQTDVTAVALDTGELAARHTRVFARHRTITAIEHARALRERRGESREPAVQTRSLARYDALIA